MCSDSGDIAVRKFPGFVDMFAHTDFPGRQAGSGGDKKRRKEGEVSEEEEERGKKPCGGIREDRAEGFGKIVQKRLEKPRRGIRKIVQKRLEKPRRGIREGHAEVFGKALRRAVRSGGRSTKRRNGARNRSRDDFFGNLFCRFGF